MAETSENMLEKLERLFEEKPMQAVNILNSTSRKCKSEQHEKNKEDNRQLFSWIYQQTLFLDSRYKLAQRIHWIVNGLLDFPACKQCCHAIDDPKQFKTIWTGYRDLCCSKCTRQHAKRDEQMK